MSHDMRTCTDGVQRMRERFRRTSARSETASIFGIFDGKWLLGVDRQSAGQNTITSETPIQSDTGFDLRNEIRHSGAGSSSLMIRAVRVISTALANRRTENATEKSRFFCV